MKKNKVKAAAIKFDDEVITSQIDKTTEHFMFQMKINSYDFEKFYLNTPGQTPFQITTDSYIAIKNAKDYTPHPIYNLQFFINFFSSIPYHLWVSGTWEGGYGRYCANGHIIHTLRGSATEVMIELKNLMCLLPVQYAVNNAKLQGYELESENRHKTYQGNIYSNLLLNINDNSILEYKKFDHPKDRVLAALEDLDLLLQGYQRKHKVIGVNFSELKKQVHLNWNIPYEKNLFGEDIHLPQIKVTEDTPKPIQEVILSWSQALPEIPSMEIDFKNNEIQLCEAFNYPHALSGVDLAKGFDTKAKATNKPAVTITETTETLQQFKPMQYTKIMETELVSEQ